MLLENYNCCDLLNYPLSQNGRHWLSLRIDRYGNVYPVTLTDTYGGLDKNLEEGRALRDNEYPEWMGKVCPNCKLRKLSYSGGLGCGKLSFSTYSCSNCGYRDDGGEQAFLDLQRYEAYHSYKPADLIKFWNVLVAGIHKPPKCDFCDWYDEGNYVPATHVATSEMGTIWHACFDCARDFFSKESGVEPFTECELKPIREILIDC